MKHPILFAFLFAAACGGGGGGKPADPKPAAELAAGTSGFPGLDWGDSLDAIKADYPSVTEDENQEVSMSMAYQGRDAKVSMVFDSGALAGVDVEYPAPFENIGACEEAFAKIKADFDGKLGASSTDNLAAYWTTPTASISLLCNPDEEEHATMVIVFTLPETY